MKENIDEKKDVKNVKEEVVNEKNRVQNNNKNVYCRHQVMKALEENFVDHEEKVASLLDGHKKAVNCEEAGNVEGQDSMDVRK